MLPRVDFIQQCSPLNVFKRLSFWFEVRVLCCAAIGFEKRFSGKEKLEIIQAFNVKKSKFLICRPFGLKIFTTVLPSRLLFYALSITNPEGSPAKLFGLLKIN